MSTIPNTHSKATQPDLVTWRPPSKVPTDPHKQPGNQGYLPGEHGEKDLNRGEIDIVTKGLSRETPPQNDQHPGKLGNWVHGHLGLLPHRGGGGGGDGDHLFDYLIISPWFSSVTSCISMLFCF